MNSQIAVIGLGQFGESLCIALTELGSEVLAIDTDTKAVNAISNTVTQAVIADITNEKVTQELNLAAYQSVILALGSDIGASILATIILKEAGVKNLWVKTSNDLQSKTLLKVGADHIINPEKTVAQRISKQLLSSHTKDFIDLGDNLAIYEFSIGKDLAGKCLKTLSLPKNVLVLALRKNNELLPTPEDSYSLLEDDILVLGGSSQLLEKILRKL